jgi:DNA-binding MarR family transcriptional regulator
MFAPQYTRVSRQTHKNLPVEGHEMSIAMSPDISSNEIRVLQAMWELKAVGTHRVTMRSLASRMPDVPDTETTETVKRLEARGLIAARKGAGGDLLALSPLGAAFVRQLQDRQLSELTRGP